VDLLPAVLSDGMDADEGADRRRGWADGYGQESKVADTAVSRRKYLMLTDLAEHSIPEMNVKIDSPIMRVYHAA
jgi:hypothetical protein